MRFRPVKIGRALAAMAFAAALFAGPLSASPQDDSSYSKARVVRLSYVTGDVQVARPEDQGWERALANMPIQEGYSIATGNGRAEIEFESGATVRMAENSEIQFNEMRLASGNRLTRMTLSQGSAIFYANLDRNDEFTVLTTGMEVTVPRNSRFRVDVTEKHVNVAVLKGNVAVQTRDGDYKLTKNQALLFDVRGGNSQVARAADADEFERWASDREDSLSDSRSASLHYVSAPFRYGVGDLSRYGTWIYAPTYGYVWQPWGVYAGWSPYFDGRWVFVRGYGWTWVSYEPWGWLPYHYGSWTYWRSSWVWVPGSLHRVGWSPGLVVWIDLGGGRRGWCPRNPFDRPGHVYHNVTVVNSVVVNTGTGILTGGRHDRIPRPSGFRYVDDDGPRGRNFFGDVDRIRSGAAGRITTAGTTGDGESGGRRLEGRTEDRFVKGDNNLGRSGAVGTAAGDANVSPSREGNVGRRFNNDDLDRGGRRMEGRSEEFRGKGRIENDASGSTELRPTPLPRPDRPGNDAADRNEFRRSRIGDPNTSVEYDGQRRRYENQPSTRVEGDIDRGRDDAGRSPRGTIGRTDPSYSPTPNVGSQPSRNDDWRGRGSADSRPSYSEPRSRMPESRPDWSDKGSRGNIGRSEPQRPSYSPPPSAPPQRPSYTPPPSPPPQRPSGSVGEGGSRPQPPPARPNRPNGSSFMSQSGGFSGGSAWSRGNGGNAGSMNRGSRPSSSSSPSRSGSLRRRN